MKKGFVTSKQQKGFTLLEIVIAIAIVALLAAAILPGLLRNRDDAQYSTALTLLQKEFPSAITRQLSRTNACNATTMTKTKFEERGLRPTTVWGANWTTSYAGNLVTIVYPLTGANDTSTTGDDMVTALDPNTNANIASVNFADPILTVRYRCN